MCSALLGKTKEVNLKVWIGKNDGTDIDEIEDPTENQRLMLSCLHPGALYRTGDDEKGTDKDYYVERIEIYLMDDFMTVVVKDA